jgi:hypothetical protein
VFQGPTHEADGRAGADFFHKILPVGFYRHGGNVEALGNVGVAHALGNEPDNLNFAFGERDVIADLGIAGGVVGVGELGQDHQDLVAKKPLAFGHRSDGLDEFGAFGTFHHVAIGTRLQGLADGVGLLAHGQDNDPHVGVLLLDLQAEVDAVEHGHVQVREHHIDPLGFEPLQDLPTVGNDARDLKALHGVEHDAEAVAHNGVVVGDENTDGVGVGHGRDACSVTGLCVEINWKECTFTGKTYKYIHGTKGSTKTVY